MTTDPKKEDLMAYLYGELSVAEKAQMEEWLRKNPDVRKEMKDFEGVRGVMGGLKDKDVVDPFFYSGSGSTSFWQITRVIGNNIIKPAIGLAASISLIILVAYFTQLNISTQDGPLTISFGEQVQTSSPNQLDVGQVELIVKQMLDEERMQFANNVQDIETGLKTQLASYYKEQNVEFRNTIDNSSQSNSMAMANLIKQMQQDNLDYLQRYLDISNSNQEQYIKAALTEFSDFLNRQREDDLVRIQYNLETLKETQDLQKMETEQILASIMNTVNNQTQN